MTAGMPRNSGIVDLAVMNESQRARSTIHNLSMQLQEEDHPRRRVELLDNIVALCEQHGLTHHECVVARQRLAEFGEEADMLRLKRNLPDPN